MRLLRLYSNPRLCLSPGPSLFQELGGWREGKASGGVGDPPEAPEAPEAGEPGGRVSSPDPTPSTVSEFHQKSLRGSKVAM